MIEILIASALFGVLIMTMSLTLHTQYAISSTLTTDRENMYASEKNLELFLEGVTTTGISLYPITVCINEASSVMGKTNFKTHVLDSAHAEHIGYDCGGLAQNKPHSPTLISSVTNPEAAITFTDIDVYRDKIYISTESDTSEHPDFYIYDAHTLSVISALDINQSINSIDVAGNSAYVAAQGTSSQFQILDISDVANPKVIAKQTLPTVTGSFPSGLSTHYYDSKVYIGTHRTAGREFHIYDVEQPASPRWLGYIEVNHNINAIAIQPPYAFLGTSGNTYDVMIYDISDPTKIKNISNISIAGDEDVLSLHLKGNELAVGRKKSRNNNPTLVVLDIQNIFSAEIIKQQNIASPINDLYSLHEEALLAKDAVTDVDYESYKAYFIDANTLYVYSTQK